MALGLLGGSAASSRTCSCQVGGGTRLCCWSSWSGNSHFEVAGWLIPRRRHQHTLLLHHFGTVARAGCSRDARPTTWCSLAAGRVRRPGLSHCRVLHGPLLVASHSPYTTPPLPLVAGVVVLWMVPFTSSLRYCAVRAAGKYPSGAPLRALLRRVRWRHPTVLFPL